jgi:hypothetical protein
MRVAQKVLQHFPYFSQNQQEMSATFSVVNSECPACYCCTAEQCFIVYAQGAVKMAWYGEVRFKQQSQNSDGLFFPTHHTVQILLPQNSTSLEPSKVPSVGKGLGVLMRLLKK